MNCWKKVNSVEREVIAGDDDVHMTTKIFWMFTKWNGVVCARSCMLYGKADEIAKVVVQRAHMDVTFATKNVRARWLNVIKKFNSGNRCQQTDPHYIIYCHLKQMSPLLRQNPFGFPNVSRPVVRSFTFHTGADTFSLARPIENARTLLIHLTAPLVMAFTSHQQRNNLNFKNFHQITKHLSAHTMEPQTR